VEDGETAERTAQRPQVEVGGEEEGDDEDRAEVVQDGEREQERPQGRREMGADDGEHSEREGDVRGHRDRPAVQFVACGRGDECVEGGGDRHAAGRGDHRQGCRGRRALGGHAEQAAQDHPEGGAGTADGDGDGHARDVAEAHGAGDGGGEGLEVVDLAGGALLVVLAAYDVDGELELAQLDEAEPAGEDDAGHDEPGDDQGKLGAGDRHGVGDDLAEPGGYGLEESADCLVDGLGEGIE
jgi:hypothetical protein